MGPEQGLLLRVKVNQVVMAMNEYSTLPRASEQDPRHWVLFSVLRRAPFLAAVSYPFLWKNE